MLNIDHLIFRYRRSSSPVLTGVSLTLRDGEIGILLGKNGAGKTTLIQNILGLRAPVSGSVRFDGRDLTAMGRRGRARLLAYVPQQITFGDLNVFDSVLMGRIAYFGLKARREDYEVVAQVLEDMGLTELALRQVTRLSGGECQKVAIARAMAQQPRLLIFDEPTGNLDIANEQLIMDEAVRLVREKGISILSSLHDLNQALSFGDRFFFMKDGKIKYQGGKECFTEEVISDIYGIRVRIVEVQNQKVILGGNHHETEKTAVTVP